MIGFLRGTVTEKEDSTVIIDVNGVGYEILVPASHLNIMEENKEITLFTHLSARDDAFKLYGFTSLEARKIFRLLIDVSGVGPKAAMNILSAIPTGNLLDALSSGKHEILQTVQGIGKKTAARLCVDLKEKAAALMQKCQVSKKFLTETGQGYAKTAGSDVVSALINLGYRQNEAEKAVAVAYNSFDNEDGEEFETLLKNSLKVLAKEIK